MRKSIEAARLTQGEQFREGGGHFEFRFEAADPTFAGHFPTRPLVPGIFQIEMVRVAAEWILGHPLVVQTIDRAKFQRPILPGEIIQLEVTMRESGAARQARGTFSVLGQSAGDVMLILGVDAPKPAV